jgi:Tetratricopeptide repeat
MRQSPFITEQLRSTKKYLALIIRTSAKTSPRCIARKAALPRRSLYKRDLSIREKIFGQGHPEIAPTLNNLAGLYVEQGRHNAEPLFKRALAIREKALGSDHRDVGKDLGDLAELYRIQGRDAEAEPLMACSGLQCLVDTA